MRRLPKYLEHIHYHEHGIKDSLHGLITHQHEHDHCEAGYSNIPLDYDHHSGTKEGKDGL